MLLKYKTKLLRYVSIAALLLFLAVALGAFGAHALANLFTAKQLANWQTAIDYMVIHAFALVVVALLMQLLPQQVTLLEKVAKLFIAGIVFFSGSLLAWSLTLFKPLVMLTPIGGILFLLGWLMLFWGLHKESKGAV